MLLATTTIQVRLFVEYTRIDVWADALVAVGYSVLNTCKVFRVMDVKS